jgi:hypothetical protein
VQRDVQPRRAGPVSSQTNDQGRFSMHRKRFLPTARATLAALVICIALSATGKMAEAQPKFWNTAKANGVNLHFGTSPTISLELQKWRKPLLQSVWVDLTP